MNFKSSIAGFTRKAIYAKHFPHSVFPPRLHCFEIEITTVSISLSISLFSLSRKWWQSTAENWKHIFVFEVSEMWKLLNHDDNSWRFKSLVWGRGKMREFRCDGVTGNWVFPPARQTRFYHKKSAESNETSARYFLAAATSWKSCVAGRCRQGKLWATLDVN